MICKRYEIVNIIIILYYISIIYYRILYQIKSMQIDITDSNIIDCRDWSYLKSHFVEMRKTQDFKNLKRFFTFT